MSNNDWVGDPHPDWVYRGERVPMWTVPTTQPVVFYRDEDLDRRQGVTELRERVAELEGQVRSLWLAVEVLQGRLNRR